MRRSTKVAIVAAAAIVVAGIGTGVGIAVSGDDDRPWRGSALDRAAEAALQHTGGGTVVETEVGDDGAAYGVEVRLPDGHVVEISLDTDFRVIGSEPDDDGPGSEDGPDTDD